MKDFTEGTAVDKGSKAAHGVKGRWVKAAAAVGVGAAVLTAGGTLAGWFAEAPIASPGTEIQAGELGLEMIGESWLYNGSSVDAADLGNIILIPGDSLAYTGMADVDLIGDMAAALQVNNTVSGSLVDSGVATVDWAVNGSQSVMELTAADDGNQIPVSWQLEMAPIGDPVYAVGTEGELTSISMDDFSVELKQVAK